jgi:hypothetical protein
MLAMTANRLSTIQRASRALLVFFIFMSVITLWGTLSNIAHPFPPDTRTLAGVVFRSAAITGKIDSLWLTQTVLGAALTLKILYHLIRLAMLHAKGQVFTAQSVAHIRQIGLTNLGALAIWLVVLIGAAPEISAAQDQWLQILPSFPGEALMCGIFFLYASRIMNEGRVLRDEQDLVV